MVTLVVATTTDPASITPASELLAMPGWQPGPALQEIKSFVNEEVRLLQHDKGIVEEDDLDKRWEEATNEVVDEVIFLSKHTAVSNRPALTVHPIGVPHLREGDVPPQGGKPGWAAPPDPRMGPWVRLLKNIAESYNLIPEFEITMEATHHGPVTNKPTMFLEIGSTEEYWKREDAAHVIALGVREMAGAGRLEAESKKTDVRSWKNGRPVLEKRTSGLGKTLVWQGLGLGGTGTVGDWNRDDKSKVLIGIGGGHYVPRHMDIIKKDGVWVGHLLSGYSLPMEDPIQSEIESNKKVIGGTWKESITAAFESTRSAFPGGEILAHLDHKSFKSWQKNAITEFLGEKNIKIGKPNDFC